MRAQRAPGYRGQPAVPSHLGGRISPHRPHKVTPTSLSPAALSVSAPPAQSPWPTSCWASSSSKQTALATRGDIYLSNSLRRVFSLQPRIYALFDLIFTQSWSGLKRNWHYQISDGSLLWFRFCDQTGPGNRSVPAAFSQKQNQLPVETGQSLSQQRNPKFLTENVWMV
jgi:hypothetical protein